MNDFIAELVISGVYKQKYDFITSACIRIDSNLLSYIDLYKVLGKWSKNKDVSGNKINSFNCEYDQWSNFFVDRSKIVLMMKNQDLELNKDYIFYIDKNEDIEENNIENIGELYLSSSGVDKILSYSSVSSVDSIRNIAYKYKYYLDNLFYLNMNVYNSDYIEDNE
jgi:hypothetical protein